MLKLICPLLKRHPWRTGAALATMIASGFFEGAGISSLLPLLTSLGIASSPENLTVLNAIYGKLQAVGLPPRPFSVGLLTASLFCCQFGGYLLQAWLVSSLSARMQTELRDELFSAFVRAEWDFLQRHETARLHNAIISEVLRVVSLLNALLSLASIAITSAIYVGLAALISWRMTVALLAAGLFVGLLSKLFLGRGLRIGRDITRFGQAIVGWSGEVLNGIKVVKANASEPFVEREFHRATSEAESPVFWTAFLPHLLKTVVDFLSFAVLLVTLLISITVFGLDITSVLVILALCSRLFPRYSTLQQYAQQCVVNVSALEQIDELLQAARPPQLSNAKNGEFVLHEAPEVRFERVSVSYDNEPVLKNIDLHIPSGQCVAFCGSSGSGKTTLLDCVSGLVLPGSGRVLIAGLDISTISARKLRKNIRYISQEVVLFNASILDNVRWDDDTASEEDVASALTQAAARKFVDELPNGMATSAGDRGTRLSGGQRQRIAIARGLLRKGKLVLVDEATSALDPDTAKAVMHSILALKDTTRIVVSHDLSLLDRCDNIFLFRKGELVGSGSLRDLREQGLLSPEALGGQA